jgi:hypothetical protein
VTLQYYELLYVGQRWFFSFLILCLLLLTNCHLQDLCNMEGFAASQAFDLLATTEAVGDDQGFGIGVAHGGQQNSLSDLD